MFVADDIRLKFLTFGDEVLQLRLAILRAGLIENVRLLDGKTVQSSLAAEKLVF